jgi:hypothetical protein
VVLFVFGVLEHVIRRNVVKVIMIRVHDIGLI